MDNSHRYCVYGLAVESDIPLGLPTYGHDGFGKVECITAPASAFLAAMQGVPMNGTSGSWYRYAVLDDGSTYARWSTVGEFLVAPDGGRIICRRVDQSSCESFEVYMLGQALSFALVRQRVEPLHATVVVVGDEGVALLGDNAFGKSSLAACFLEAGARLLTDDLLVLHESSDGVFAYPGPPRIKLFPKIARRFLGDLATGARMNADTDKMILPLDEDRQCSHPVQVTAIYSLAAPRDACRRRNVIIEALSPREAFVALVGGTFNRQLVSPQRLERQFSFVARLTDLIAVKKLAYPRTVDRLPEVPDAVLLDLARARRPVRPASNVERGHLH